MSEVRSEASVVRRNLLTQPGYTPYCGHQECRRVGFERWPRTRWNGKQFECRNCGWQSSFEPEFIDQYKQTRAKQ